MATARELGSNSDVRQSLGMTERRNYRRLGQSRKYPVALRSAMPMASRSRMSIHAGMPSDAHMAFINAALGTRCRSVCLASELSPIHREQH